MESSDHVRILMLAKEDPALKKLYSKHLKLEKTIKRLEQFSPYSPTSELQSRDLKKQKLHGVDKMMRIIGSNN